MEKLGKAPDMSDEIAVLIAEFEVRQLIIDCDQRTVESNKNDAWAEIKSKVDAVSVHPRSLQQLKVKLKNIKSSAKSKHTERKRSAKGTGGGPPSKVRFTDAEERLVALYGASAAWCGIPGGDGDSNLFQGLPEWPKENVPPQPASTHAETHGESSSEDEADLSLAKSETLCTVRRASRPSTSSLRELQFRALETQIEANQETIRTMQDIRNILIPSFVARGAFTDQLLE